MNVENIFITLVRLALLLFVLPFHECAHAAVSDWLGDDTAKLMGRKTLNPFAHLDLFGSVLILFSGFGWAKPVPVSTRGFRHRKRDMAITALAGPAANVLLAFIFVAAYKISWHFVDYSSLSFYVSYFIYFIIRSTLALAVFNMLPIPPLDGSRVVTALLPDRLYDAIMRYERVIFGALMMAVFLGVFDKPISQGTDFLLAMVDSATAFLGN